MKKALEKYGAHTFLLPVFYILHNYLYYAGLVSAAVAAAVLLKMELLFLVVFLLLWLIGRKPGRSLQVTTLVGFIVLFFGAIKDFFDNTLGLHFIGRYAVLLPLLLLTGSWLTVQAWRKQDFRRLFLFQNLLLLVLLLIDLCQLAVQDAGARLRRNPLVTSSFRPDTLAMPPNRPDVYFLVFDSYPGDGVLRDCLQYDNSGFDEALEQRGFRVLAHPHSNYNRTQFSIACTFNAAHLQGLSLHAQAGHYNQAIRAIGQSAVPQAFLRWGYAVYNLSIFRLGDHPALQQENFLTMPEDEMLLYNTFPGRFTYDLQWHFWFLNKYLPQHGRDRQRTQQMQAEKAASIKAFNTIAIDSLLRLPASVPAGPKFVYAHLYLPHIPLSYDSNGHSMPRDTSDAPAARKAALISYLKYTNKTILKIVDSILQHAKQPPVIIVQSDHGYRDLGTDIVAPARYYDNYSAFYIPGRRYAGLYDSLSNINTFPVLFNTCFGARLPLQKDSIVELPFP